MDKTETKEMQGEQGEQGEHEERSIIGFFFGAGPYDGYWYGDTPKDKRPPFWWRTKLREEVIQLRSELQKAKEENQLLQQRIDKDFDIIDLREKLEKAKELNGELVKPKYKLHQVVWINGTLKAKQFTCRALKILCTYGGYSASEWGETTRGTGGYPWRVQYSESGNPQENEWVSEEMLFETKEDLLKSL